MDRITASLMNEFVIEEGLEKLPSDQQFEHFASYLCIQKHFTEVFDTSDVVTGKGGDTGIDAIAMVINGSLVTDVESVTELIQTNGYLDVTFVFVQAEQSSSFDTSKVGQFGFGVSDFFSQQPTLSRNEKIIESASIMSRIFLNSSRFKRHKPICRLYYCTTGKYSGDQNLAARRLGVIQDLDQTQLFRDVDFQYVDADELQRLFNQAKNAISKEFNFSERTTIPEIPGVNEAYLGLIPVSEFIKLLQDDSGGINKSLFYDNVRDWQDYNPVNTEIKETLSSPDERLRFALMNNGVTIIAKTLRPTGDRFYIEDFQIVNGCQTSHVLFNEQGHLDDKVMVPLRVISTQDESVINSIIKATNRQTEVKTEQLLALSDFQKKLELFFESFDGPKKLHYERRSRQFNNQSGIEKTRIISPANLIRAFASMFLEEPHRTTRNYSALLDQVGKTIFVADHRLEPYYVSAISLYQLEYLFRNQQLDPKFKPARFQVLMTARLLLDKRPLPRYNSKDMARYCDDALTVWNSWYAEDLLQLAADVVNMISGGNLHRDHIRTQPFTESLKAAVLDMQWTPPAAVPEPDPNFIAIDDDIPF
jgi:hypothetical protein